MVPVTSFPQRGQFKEVDAQKELSATRHLGGASVESVLEAAI